MIIKPKKVVHEYKLPIIPEKKSEVVEDGVKKFAREILEIIKVNDEHPVADEEILDLVYDKVTEVIDDDS